MSWRAALAALLLALQLAGIGAARFSPSRYFSWAPFDMQTDYTISAQVDGRPLSADELAARYRIPAVGTDHRSYAHVLEIVRLVETSGLPGRPAHVQVVYRINGGPERHWRWP